jgi:hypothetical protein
MTCDASGDEVVIAGDAQVEAAEDDLAARARTILGRIAQDAEKAIETNAAILAVNEDRNLLGLFRNVPEARGLNTIHYSLGEQLTMIVARMHDPVGRNRASLPHLMRLLGGWEPDFQAIGPDVDPDRAREAVARARNAHDDLVRNDPGRTLLGNLRGYRNANVAHSLFDMGEQERALFRNVDDLLQMTVPVVEDLAYGLAGVEWDLRAVHAGMRARADAFWAVVVGGMEARRAG